MGRQEDARGWLRSVIERGASGNAEERLSAMLGLVGVSIHFGDFAGVYDGATEAEELAEAIGAKAVVPVALHHQAIGAVVTGRGDQGALLVEALARAERLEDPVVGADVLKELGELRLVQTRYDEGAQFLDRAIAAIRRSVGNEVNLAHYLTSRCVAAHLAGDDEQAIAFGEEAIGHARAYRRRAWSGSDWGGGVVYAAPVLGLAVAALGRFRDAYELIAEGMAEVE